MQWYMVRIYDDKGEPLSTRVEQADNPREACRLAYGVIYDRPTDTARYKAIGKKHPSKIGALRKHVLNGSDGWLPIPTK